MVKLCEWQVISSSSYGASYKCMNCGAYHEEFCDENEIALPPIRSCDKKREEDKK